MQGGVNPSAKEATPSFWPSARGLRELEVRKVSVVALTGMTFNIASATGRVMATKRRVRNVILHGMGSPLELVD